MHGPDCAPECFGCKVLTIQVNAYTATPNRLHPQVSPRRKEPVWEKGTVKDARGMPYLENGEAIPVKRWSENHRHYEDALRYRDHYVPQLAHKE